MSRMNELFMKRIQTGSLEERGDEDYFYEQYLLQEKLNEEYWEYVSKLENQPNYTPTPEEEQQNFEERYKQENE